MTGSPLPLAAIYCRISQDREGAGLGVDRQETECRELAETHGWRVVVVHTDNDISAFSGKPRPGYRALVADLESGAISAVIAWHTDRLHRSPLELETYIDICERRGVTTHTVRAGHLDLSTPSGRMTARIAGAVARQESEHKGDRIRAARRQAALAGRYIGSSRPFGFEADGMTVRPNEAAEIARAIDALLAGAGLRSVTRDLNGRGFATTFGAHAWSAQSLKDVLLRPRNAGLAVYRGEIIGQAGWPAIVSEDRWRAVVALLTDPSRTTTPGGPVRHLGSGLYVCGVCGEPRLRVSTSGQKKPAYRCNARESAPQSTGHVSRQATALDAYVEAVIIERLSRPDAARLLSTSAEVVDTTPLHAEATGLRHRLEQIADAHADGDITLAQLTRGTKRIRTRLDEIDTQVARATAVDPLIGLANAPEPAQVWKSLDIGRRRAVLNVLATVTVLPWTGRRGPDGSRFDPNGVRIDWKHALS